MCNQDVELEQEFKERQYCKGNYNIQRYITLFQRVEKEIKKQEEGKNVGARIIESNFIAMKIYNNSLTLVRDFLSYTESILSLSPDEAWIPALHYTHSSIEGLFSCIRAMQKERRDLYACDILLQNMIQNLKDSKTLW